MNQLTFQSLCKNLKGKPSFSSNIDDLNTLIGAVASLIGDPATGTIGTLINALAEKERLISLGKAILDKILDQNPADYSGRVDQMKMAYGTIYFTAFFDELDHQLPENIRRNIQLSWKEKNVLSHYTALTRNSGQAEEIIFPNIVYGYSEVDAHLKELYQSMTDRVRDFVNGLSFHDTASEKDICNFDEVMKNLPMASIKRFHDQYLVLCGRFNEFYIYTQLEREKGQKFEWEDQYKTILSIAMRTLDSSEAGLANLKKIVIDLPNRIKKDKVQEIVDELIGTYQASIERPLIETKSGEEKLIYPLISEAFIPQAYKLLRYSGKEHLEQAETWNIISTEQDMMSFWARYCLDPGSLENLLLILGEPGGGKSLLTRILCARMIAPANIFIRIPLREHDMEDEIESIICRQIEKDGDASEPIPTFKWFAEEFQDNPITLLFDGYDEVMQATGGVYRNLLTRIRRFQDRCQEQHRPVRIVVTSRETLIDKADIPKNTSVMKLLEFDNPRKEQWVDIWNRHNHTILAKAGIKEFSLPKGNKDIEDLSGQPLLLLMLAIYDANFETKTNALKQKCGQTESLDRTKLYDELLRRFIRRELRKGPRGQDRSFNEVDDEEQVIMVDEEMKKLGIAALGMFVREKLSLTVGELEDDLGYMKAKATDYGSKNKKTLKNAEAVFGSFFFIHDSRTESDDDEKEAEFEFLHKTFYEFLVADLILQYLIDTVDNLNELKSSEKRGEAHYLAALDNSDFPDDAYYAALNSACLCTEPEIIQMISEWQDSKLKKYFQGKRPEFDGIMDQVTADLLSKHAAMIRTKIFTPFTSGNSCLVGNRSYLQACAVYLMNLLILRILTSGQCRLEMAEWSYISQFLKLNAPLPQKQKRGQPTEFSDRRPVRKFKIALSEEIILKFMALFQIKRDGNHIVLTKRMQTGKFERENLQKARMDVFDFIQDNITGRVYRLHDADSSLSMKQQYRHDLDEQGFDLDFELAVAQLHEIVLSSGWININELDDILQPGIECLGQNYADVSLVLDWLLCLRLLIDKIIGLEPPIYRRRPSRRRTLGTLTEIIVRRYIDERQIVFTYLEIIKELDCGEVLLNGPWLKEALIHLSDISPDLAVAFIEVIPYNIEARIPFQDREFYTDQPGLALVQYTNSPKVIGALLKFFYVVGNISPTDSILWKIQKNWDQYFLRFPEELPELLQIYIQMGKLGEVKGFLKYIERERIGMLVNRYPVAVIGFLSVAQVVGEDRNFSRCIVQHIEKNSTDMEKLLQHPPIIMKLLHHVILDRHNQDSIHFLAQYFLRRYDEMFCANPEEAVDLLFKIPLNRISFEDREWIPKACIYSIHYYSPLVETSVKAAAHLLVLVEKLKKLETSGFIRNLEELYEPRKYNLRYPDSYVERCFNKALFIRDRTDISSLTELLDCLDASLKGKLKGFFAEKYPYIRTYSWKLAEEIAKIYGFF